MIIDAHTHIFPPVFRERREELLGQLRRGVEQGKLVDLSQVELEELPEPDRPMRIVAPERSGEE